MNGNGTRLRAVFSVVLFIMILQSVEGLILRMSVFTY